MFFELEYCLSTHESLKAHGHVSLGDALPDVSDRVRGAGRVVYLLELEGLGLTQERHIQIS